MIRLHHIGLDYNVFLNKLSVVGDTHLSEKELRGTLALLVFSQNRVLIT